MQKCPYCAEEIKDEALKCKHCGSDLQKRIQEEQEQKQEKQKRREKIDAKATAFAIKVFIGMAWIVVAVWFWYVVLPGTLIWWTWKKSKLSTKTKKLFTIFAIIFFLISSGIAIKNESDKKTVPVITFTEPAEGASFQATETTIMGIVEPKDAVIKINSTIVPISDGAFSQLVSLTGEDNSFSFIAYNANNNSVSSRAEITIHRIYTPQELAEFERKRVEKEEARRIAEEERRVKALAEQQAWEASAAGKICTAHPEWSRNDCERLADNKIWVGMSLDMLKYKRGLPNSANPSNYGYGTQWQWCWHNFTPSCFYDEDEDGLVDSYN